MAVSSRKNSDANDFSMEEKIVVRDSDVEAALHRIVPIKSR